MVDHTALLALAVRCEAAKGADRELDVEIAHALPQFGGMVVYRSPARHDDHDDGWRKAGPMSDDPWNHPLDRYTVSLDAVRTLQARVLPGHRIEVVEYEGGWDVTLRSDVGRAVATSIDAKTEEGGRLAALLRAKAKEGEG